MASIAECRNDINRYNTLKVRVNTVINYLSSASNNAESLSNTIKNNYTVNDASTPITNKVKDKITEMYKYLQNTVLPAIDRSITDLNNTIARLEREERERREREERERREREEREREARKKYYW